MGWINDLSKEELHGFALLVAQAMSKDLHEAMREAIHEYMGQNGKKHREDHEEIAMERERRAIDAKARVAAEEEARRDAKTEAAERKKFRRGVMSGVIVAVVVSSLNVAAKLFGWY